MNQNMQSLKAAFVIGSMFGAGVVIDEHALLPVGTIVSICGLIWWLGRKLQSIDDSLKSLEKGQQVVHDRIDHLACKQPGYNRGDCKNDRT